MKKEKTMPKTKGKAKGKGKVTGKEKGEEKKDMDLSDVSDENDTICLECTESYSASKPGQEWIQCTMFIVATAVNRHVMSVRDDFTDCKTDVRLDGKVALVTGATSGTGLEIAKNLSKRGARVIIASRNPNKLEKARNIIVQSSGNQNVVTRQMDFESLTSVRNFVDTTLSTESRLDILINNIGAIGLDDRLTEDNLQLMMQVNYFGSFLLTFLLFPFLKSSAPSRIVNVSSLALLLGDINLERWNKVGEYSNFGFYCNAKLADVLFTVEMAKRIKGSGVNVYSMDPGLGKSEFFRNFDNQFIKNSLNAALLKFGRPLPRVSTMAVYLAVDPKFEKESGKHFRDCHEFFSTWFVNETVLLQNMWKESKKLVRISYEEDWENNRYY